MELPVDYTKCSSTYRKAIREEYVKRQEGKCFYCGEPLTGPPAKKVSRKSINKSLFPPQFLKWPVHLQHNHKTGMTEGAVHCYCNAVMWQYENR